MSKLPVRVASSGKVTTDEDIPRPDNFEGYIFPSLDLLEDPDSNYPNFEFDGQTVVLEDYLEVKPENKDRIYPTS